jgi:molybdate transport system ATP-binding protein
MISWHMKLQHGGFALDAQADVPSHGITAVFGPSGAGKSSLLMALAGLQAADGYLRMDGQDVALLPAHKRRIGLVFQDARLFAHLSVRANVEYALARASAGPFHFEMIAQATGLLPLLARDVASLSGGERQRVAIARALGAQPRLLLMDEPLSALDLPRRAEMLSLIETLPKRLGIPVMYVTHAIDEVARIADHVVLMRAGRVALAGPVQEIFADARLDAFSGHFEAGSLLSGEVVGEDAELGLSHIRVDGAQFSVPVTGLARGAVRLRIRARDVAIALERPSGLSIRNIIPARIVRMEAQGAHSEVFLEAGGQALRARITRASAVEMGLCVGQSVHALVKTIAVDRQLFSP